MTTPGAPRPSAAVLRAFRVAGHVPERLPGGRGTTWRVGDVVLRPAGDVQEAQWRSDVLARLPHTVAFRTPRPVPASGGGRVGDRWVVDGWEAWEWLEGTPDPARVEDVVRAGTAFHRAVSGLARPSFLDRVDDPWSRAERLVWADGPAGADRLPDDPLVRRLTGALRPVRGRCQLVHRDLLGNVLFAAGRPPAVFDWAPTWRPAGYGAAVAVVDAVCWHGTPLDRLAALRSLAEAPEWPQLLVRALAFRIVTLHLLGAWDTEQHVRHRPVVDALLSGSAGTLDVP
ncbi:TIGR02569 family protein [Curtobacterium citreum]|uniref:Aminoglycoside phosphotransferase n=1 Tax=Curtobacterium citreum TaxID=2036 RepID=A0ABT2HJK3_9MICO|nr:hypothetical protein [Curtobacterium citreum]MCS6523455.1 hypothetical protein [Curtobacterium citreum]TQJ27691.1 uncharacterized protein (TIGR02569 family) [Curtobacterium citreum]GGL84407.1 TIGR02569 family protein [Curtobacterium citreum]